MKRKALIPLFAILICILFGLFPPCGMAEGKVITLKVANWFPTGTKYDVILQEWGKDLEKRAGGKVKVNYYPAGTLVSAAQTYDAIVKGIIDVGNQVLGYSMGRFPFSKVLDMPIGWPQGPDATVISNKFYKKFKPKEFDDVKVLLFHGQTSGFVHTKTRPVTKLEDLAGLKVRCYGSNAKFVANLGAAPVAMPMPEVYDALAKGVVDGVMSDYAGLYVFKVGEHIKYSTENTKSAYSAAFIVAMNKRKFASLPPDIQAIIEDLSEEYIAKYGKIWTDDTVTGKAWLEKRGVKIITLSKEEEARWYEKGTQPLVDAYIEEMKAMGLPGEEAVKFLLDSFRQSSK
jgi:TRAP-type C4-dicarboxylate transport system substrate-binding protein